MGLFSDKCVNCGTRVWKGSRVCPQCGVNAPNTIIKCPACKKEVSTRSKFCWNCKKDLTESARDAFRNNRWLRVPGDFATKVDTSDLEGKLRKKLTVEYGTKAMLFQRQEFKGVLPSGEYDLGGFLKVINNFELKVSSFAVLVDVGDVIVEIVSENVTTKDKIQVGVICNLILRFEESGAEKFVMNILKDKNQYRTEDLKNYLKPHVEDIVRAFMGDYSIKELADDPEGARQRFETRLNETEDFTANLNRAGLNLIHVQLLRIKLPEEYKKLESEEGALVLANKTVALAEAKSKITQRLHELDEIEDRVKRRKARLDFLSDEEKKNIFHQNELNRRLNEAKTEYEKEKLRFEIERIKNDLEWIKAQRRIELLQRLMHVLRLPLGIIAVFVVAGVIYFAWQEGNKLPPLESNKAILLFDEIVDRDVSAGTVKSDIISILQEKGIKVVVPEFSERTKDTPKNAIQDNSDIALKVAKKHGAGVAVVGKVILNYEGGKEYYGVDAYCYGANVTINILDVKNNGAVLKNVAITDSACDWNKERACKKLLEKIQDETTKSLGDIFPIPTAVQREDKG